MITAFIGSKFTRFILLVTLIIVSENTYSQDDTLKIIHISDPHVVYQLNECNPIFVELREHLLGSEDSLKNFMKSVPSQINADAVIITGDLIDYYEAVAPDGNRVGNQVEQFAKLYNNFSVPTYLTLGNHDISNYLVDINDSIKVETQNFADCARASFIRNISCFQNGTYYKKEYQVGETKYHLIFLDNGYSLHDRNRRLDKTQLDWLSAQLDEIGDDPVVLFFHIYIPVGDINGDGIYFRKNKPPNWPGEKEYSEGFLKILNKNENIKAMFVGHQHRNVWEEINFTNGHRIYQIQTSSLVKKMSNWRVITFVEDEIIVSKPGTNEIETGIKVIK